MANNSLAKGAAIRRQLTVCSLQGEQQQDPSRAFGTTPLRSTPACEAGCAVVTVLIALPPSRLSLQVHQREQPTNALMKHSAQLN